MVEHRLSWAQAFVIVLFFLASAVGCMLLAGAIRGLGTHAPISASLEIVTQDPINILLAQATATIVSLVVSIRWLKIDDWIKAVAIRAASPRIIALAMIAGIALQFPLTELTNVLYLWFPLDVEEQLAYQRLLHPDNWLIAMVTAVAIVGVAPIGEELLFRGLIFRGLCPTYRPVGAVLVSALLFGFAHMGPIRFIYATIVGVILAILLFRTDSILPCIACHAAFNAVPLLLPSSVFRIPGFNTVSAEVEHLPWPLLALSTLFFLAAFLLAIRRPLTASDRPSDSGVDLSP